MRLCLADFITGVGMVTWLFDQKSVTFGGLFLCNYYFQRRISLGSFL